MSDREPLVPDPRVDLCSDCWWEVDGYCHLKPPVVIGFDEVIQPYVGDSACCSYFWDQTVNPNR